MMRLAFTLMLVLAVSARGASPTEREQGDTTIQARAILKKYCAECHQPGGQSFDILDHAELIRDHPVPFAAAKGGRSQIIEFIEDGSMPPAGKPRPDFKELGVLKAWLGNGPRPFPKRFDEAYVATTVQADWDRREKAPSNFRYISFAHTIQDSTTGLDAQEKKLRAALSAATTKPVEFEPVDPTGTVFRLNIVKAGWNARDQFVSARGNDVSPLRAFDLVLLENPFPVPDVQAEVHFPKPRVATPTAYLRADWLSDVLAPGSPLAAELRSLVELQGAKEGEPTCGPKPRPFESTKSASGSAPITAWYHTGGTGRLKVEFIARSGVEVNTKEMLEFELKSDVNVNFRVLRVLADGYTTVQPVAGGEALNAGEPRTFTIRSSDKAGTVEHFILVASPRDNPIPVPTIVRSEHSTLCDKDGLFPIHRFLFVDKEEKFDPSKCERRVVTVRTKKQ